jgi:hypothetical protein
MQKTLKKILIRILYLLVLAIVMNIVYSKYFFEADIQKHSSIINRVRNVPLNTDVVYLAESSNFSYHKNDRDTRKISEFIDEYTPDIKVDDISKAAAHAGVYKVLLQHIPDNSNISTVVVTLNMRSFNAQWIYSDLETSLQKSLMLLRDRPPLLSRFLLSFKAYDIKTPEEREKQFIRKWKKDKLVFPYDFPHQNVYQWNRWKDKQGYELPPDSVNWDQIRLACHYIKAYGFQIDTLKNPRIADFDQIVELANQRGWNLVFNLLSENTDKAASLVGNDLIFLMNQNRQLLIDYYSSKGVIVVDNFFTVPDNQFIDQDWTTEHYAQKGREDVARNVANVLNDIYSNK